MIETIKRKRNGIIAAMAMIITMWWLVAGTWWIDTKPAYLALSGTVFLIIGMVADVLLDWYRNPATPVDGWEDSN